MESTAASRQGRAGRVHDAPSGFFLIFESLQIQCFMGKGDKKTKKGKIIMGSFGVSRPHKKKAGPPSAAAPAKEKKTKDKKAK